MTNAHGSQAGNSQQNVRVVVRIRPRDAAQAAAEEGQALCVHDDPVNNTIILPTVNKSFQFDGVFGPGSTQEQTFGCVKPLIEGFMQGYNATVLAYGQTGSGKTYTMACGDSGLYQANDPSMGIMPRVIDNLFEEIKQRPECECELHASYLEIYNDDMFDLLQPDVDPSRVARGSDQKIRIVEDPVTKNVNFLGVAEERVHDVQDCLNILSRGSTFRRTAATVMNSHSSRSHAIFTLTLVQNQKVELKEDGASPTPRPNSFVDAKMSKFHFVDLAGSERAKRTQASGSRLKEGCHINSGLLALGNVICALTASNPTSDDHARHVPYRDSKLTRLLQDSLGGNARTVMIACVSGAVSDFAETHNAIGYASRARNIKNRAVVNRDPQNARITALQLHIAQLTRENAELKQRNAHGVNAESLRRPPSEGLKPLGDGILLGNFKKRVADLETTVGAFRAREHEMLTAYLALKNFAESSGLDCSGCPPLPSGLELDEKTGVAINPEMSQQAVGRLTTELEDTNVRIRLLEQNQETLQDALREKCAKEEALMKQNEDLKNKIAARIYGSEDGDRTLGEDDVFMDAMEVEPASSGSTAQGIPEGLTLTLQTFGRDHELAAERELEKERLEFQQVASEEDRALEEKSSAQNQLLAVEHGIVHTTDLLDKSKIQQEEFRSDNARNVQEMSRLQKQAHDAVQEKESLEKRIREYEKANNAQALKKLENQHIAVARRNQSLEDQIQKLKEHASAADKKSKEMQALSAKYQADLKKFQCDRGRLQKELNDKDKQHRDAVRKKEIVFQQSQRRMAAEHRTLSKKAESERQRRVLVERKFEALKGKNEMFVNMQKRRVDGRQAKQRGRLPPRGPLNQKDRSSSCVITGVGIGSKDSLNLSGAFGSALNATLPNSLAGEAGKMRLPSNPNDKDEVLTFMRQTLTREMEREDDAEQVQKYQQSCNDLKDRVIEQRKRVNLLEQNELYATVPEDKHAYRYEKEQAAMHLISLTDQLEHTRS